MPLSTDIRLPKNVVPTFPNRCIYSNSENPDAEAVVVANSQSAFLAFLAPILLVFGWRRVRVPIMRKYRTRFYIRAFGRDALMIVLIFVAVFLIMPMLSKDDPFRKFKCMGLVLAALSPWILFEVAFPRRFDVTARRDWVDYEFAAKEYAAEFAMLNAKHIIKVQ